MTWTRDQIAQIAAKLELKNGMYVNLGIGMPTNLSNYVPDGINVILHSENGMLGMGPHPTKENVDPDLINAGKETITGIPGCCFFDSAISFAMVRGKHIDLTVLGALQVSEKGDLANWSVPGKMIKGMGGAMDLVSNVKRVVVVMDHINKDGEPKLVDHCDYPLTGQEVVDRIITSHGVFDVDSKEQNLQLIYKPDNISVEEIRDITNAYFVVKNKDLSFKI